MNIYEDYEKYRLEQNDLLDRLQKEAPTLLSIFDDVLLVLDYVRKLNSEHSTIEPELAELFEVGFGYFSNVMVDMNLYYQDYFKNDMAKMQQYAPLILYHFYIDDYRCHLDNEEYLTTERSKVIQKIEDDIDQILANNLPYDENKIGEYEMMIEEISPRNDRFQPVYAIYSIVAEELNIF